MHSFITFLQANWPLASLFVLILIYIVFEESREHSDDHASPQFCVSLMNHENAMVWDVRQEDTYKAGHIVGAVHVSPDAVLQRFQSLSKADQKRPVILVCQRGVESVKLLKKIKQETSEHEVVAMHGGMAQWLRDELPVTNQGASHG